jgi:hypothetical protein
MMMMEHMHLEIPFEEQNISFIGLAYEGKDIVFRFIIEYTSSMDFGP